MTGWIEKTRWLAGFWSLGGSGAANDGYGQSWLDDVRSARRFRALKKQRLTWRPPGDWPGDIGSDFPVLGRFGDGVVAWRSAEGEDWFVVERVWHGWPDPPEFAVFAFDAQKRIVTAYDFDAWPGAWTKP